MITSKKVNEAIVKLRKKAISEANLTPEQSSLDKSLTQYLIDAIKATTGKDTWQFRVTNNNIRNSSGNVVGSWIQVSRNPPSSVPKLYEFVDFKCYYDFKDQCYLYYAFGRDRGESKSKTFKASPTSIKQTLVSIFKSLYFTGNVPNLDKVIDITKLSN